MADYPPSATSKWLSFFADTSVLEDENPCHVLWTQQQAGQADCSEENILARVGETEDPNREVSALRKRSRDDCGGDAACNKANREKKRRDRLNDRFIELSQALEGNGKPPKTDKATILCDAVRVIGQLRHEAVSLQESNEQLKEQIKELKVEKNELRAEKFRLKEEKNKLEEQAKSVVFQPSFAPHAAAIQAAATAYASRTLSPPGIPAKLARTTPAPPVAMWQWLPPAAVDTSQDHVLRPPVA